jgi:hypothetical protein
MLSRFIAGTVLGTALLTTLTGCTASGNTGAPAAASGSPSPSPKPAAVLAAAVTKTTGVSLKVVLAGDTADENLTGSYDGTHNIGSISQVSGSDRMTITVTADDLYLSGLSDFKGKTMHLKIAKLSAKSPLAMFTDVLTPLTLLTAATEVTSTAPTSFTGTLDLTNVHGATAGSQKFLDHVVAAAAGRANAVKFTASVNEQGYLTEFDATLPNIDNGKDSDYDLKFSDFGSTVSVTKPTGSNVIEAPAALYSEK